MKKNATLLIIALMIVGGFLFTGANTTSKVSWEYKFLTVDSRRDTYDQANILANKMANDGWELFDSEMDIGSTHAGR